MARRKFSEHEIELIKSAHETKTLRDLCDEMPERQAPAISNKAKQLGVRLIRIRCDRYTINDDVKIEELAAKGLTSKQIAVELGRSWASIRTRCTEVGIVLSEVRLEQYDNL